MVCEAKGIRSHLAADTVIGPAGQTNVGRVTAPAVYSAPPLRKLAGPLLPLPVTRPRLGVALATRPSCLVNEHWRTREIFQQRASVSSIACMRAIEVSMKNARGWETSPGWSARGAARPDRL